MNQNFFDLLQLPKAFVIDLKKLDQNYQSIQKEIHPDRFASLGDDTKLESIKKTAQVNDAYQTLKSPIRRAEYLLQLHGVNIHDEKYTAVPQDFLMQQMEWREELETHKQDKLALEKLAADIQKNKNQMINQLPAFFDNKDDLNDAIKTTRELNFIEKIEQHIHDALIEII
ncbi:MAG: Fe-S protein assembly co-chaperone HscB [Betaproteobacteria bacterium]|nr:Fe-S protein assembly co-chaperone HscB [Betaproteobacteria bacterium]